MIESAILAPLYRTVRFWVVAFGVAILGGLGAARAQQFSADIVVQRDAATTPAGRLRLLDGKIRIETPEFADGFFLVDAAKPSAYFVRPGAGIYMDARQSSQLTRLLVPVDPDEPCRQWQAMAHLAGLADNGDWHCERTGEEMIQGRTTAVFHVVVGAGPAFFGWVDRERRIPLRIKREDGTVIAVENIRDEPQSASSFELPAGFRKFSPEALIEQIKQSDVWVADQKDKPQR
ncbi:hypothetical protein [Bradyrhizobium sp. LTSP885]|uniref:hypothetical protein n=1 Tax=Bradyrhizobium sp. LTSP885 TaxID=1619232 RepID=UPI00069ABBB2|nr:hypothetical protein [Bradyrhizobium sp. LTSP885]